MHYKKTTIEQSTMLQLQCFNLPCYTNIESRMVILSVADYEHYTHYCHICKQKLQMQDEIELEYVLALRGIRI